jgi:hypothetical protein
VRLQVTQNFYAVQIANYVEHKLATLPKKFQFKFHQLGVAPKKKENSSSARCGID